MKALVSNKLQGHPVFGRFDKRIDKAFTEAQSVAIGTGFVSVAALMHIAGWVKKNPGKFGSVKLYIGLPAHLKRPQHFEAARYLNEVLEDSDVGHVYVVRDFPFHGKIYLFGKDGESFLATVGSSNLGAIVKNHHYVEIDLCVDEPGVLAELESFTNDVLGSASVLWSEFEVSESATAGSPTPAFDFYADIVGEDLSVFEGLREGIRRLSDADLATVRSRLATGVFRHRIKTADGWPGQEKAPASSLNVYHGKGRDPKDGRPVKPRPWYEVELMLSADEMDDLNVPPRGKDFEVVTDDGWVFTCSRQGDNGKQIRSKNTTLLVLGKWLKGRLETSGALRVGDYVTNRTLETYGTRYIRFTEIEDGSGSGSGRWYLDFSVPPKTGSA